MGQLRAHVMVGSRESLTAFRVWRSACHILSQITALLALLALSVLAGPATDAAEELVGSKKPDRIVLAVGEFKPMVFLGPNGEVTGMYTDLLRLWSEKTGVQVDLRIMDWSKTIPALLAGEVDAVEGVSYTPERAALLDFTSSHGEFPAYIYFNESIGGVRGLADLSGFSVGVLAGSNVEDFLRATDVQVQSVPYASYEDMVQAAVHDQINVFIGEEPMIPFLLAENGRNSVFHRTEVPILLSDMRTAVRKGNAALLAVLDEGFAAITPAEKQKVYDEWVGVNLASYVPWQWIGWGLAATLGVLGLLFVWSRQLQRRVTRATQTLRESEEREREFAQQLSALHDISLELSKTQSHDELCRMAVVLGMDRLGFERLGIWFLTQDPEVLIGSYGVDERGQIRDERNSKRVLSATESAWRDVVTGKVPSRVDADTAQGDDLGNPVSRGWAAIAVLRDRDQILGVVSTDTLISGKPITEHMHQLLLLYAGDIAHLSRRRRDEAALRESEERYRTFFLNTSEGIYRYETRRPIPTTLPVDKQHEIITEDVYIAECNEAMARMHGYSRAEEFIGAGLRALSAEDPRNQAYVTEFIRSGYRLDEFPSLATDPDGGTRYFMNSLVGFVENDHLVRAWGIQRDVTEHKRAEEALRARDEMIRSLVDTSRDWIWTIDLNGIHTFSNPAVETILGYRPDEIVGTRSIDLIHEEDLGIFSDQFPKWVAEARGWRNIMIRWRHKEGGWRFLESSAVPILDSAGTLSGFRGVDRDVTDRKLLQEQLLQSQKMEAVGQLAGGIAHDFNNLLQAILGYTDIVLRKLKPDDTHYGDLEQVRLAAERASALTRQLLTFSRRQVIQPVPIDINEVIAGLMKMLCRLIGEHIQLDLIPGHRLGTVHADISQIEQVLLNLCVNARDAMPNGGQLTIETENVVIDKEFMVSHPWAQEGRYVLISVTDTGCGMDKQTLPHVFEPFFTTKPEGAGTGLGLATVYGIVKHHDGMIHAYSELGKGTTFKVYLPISQRSAVTIGDKVLGKVPGGTETILIAEDEEMILNLAARMLREAGYTVLTASDGMEALRVFEEHGDKIDLALLDVVMPRLGGRDAQKRIHEKRPQVRFLFASGYSANAIHTNFVLGEDMQLIQKPYQRDALLRKVREVLDAP